MSLAQTDIMPEVSMPIFTIGFPSGQTGPAKSPIWKLGR